VYADLLFQKSGSNLILKVGATDQITFTDYYADSANRSVSTLQVVLEGSADYDKLARVERWCVSWPQTALEFRCAAMAVA
jgi:hypothetical protein